MRVMQIHFWGDARNLTGSVEKVLSGFAELAADDIDLDIASCGNGEPQSVGRTTYVFFQENRLINRVLNKWLGLRAFTFPSLVRLIEARHPDLIHIHNRQELADEIFRRLSYRPKILLHYHRHFKPYRVPECADVLIAVSESVRRDLAQSLKSPMPIEVIHNPVPERLLAENACLPERRPAAKPRLLYGGGLQEHKGWLELSSALSDPLLADKFDITLCGPGFTGYTPPFAAKNAGLLDQRAFLHELAATDIVVMPSHHEGFPLLALETMAMGKVLIATLAGGLGEIVDAGNAVVHKVGDRDDLLRALIQGYALFAPVSAGALVACRENAKRSVADYSPARVNARLAAVYRKYVRC